MSALSIGNSMQHEQEINAHLLAAKKIDSGENNMTPSSSGDEGNIFYDDDLYYDEDYRSINIEPFSSSSLTKL